MATSVYLPSYRRKGLGRGAKAAMYYASKLPQPVTFRRAKGSFYPAKRNYSNRNKRTGGFIDVESKFVDYALSTGTIDEDGAFADEATADCLNAVAIGTDYNTRVGRRVKFTSVHIRGVLSAGSEEAQTSPFGDELVRLILYIDTQTNAAQNALSQVTGGLTNFRDLQYTSRYKILKDKIYRLPANSVCQNATNDFSVPQTLQFIKLNCKLNMVTKFVGTTAVVGSIADNSIHLGFFNYSGETNRTCSFTGVSRCRFNDL